MCEECVAFDLADRKYSPPDCDAPSLMTGACCCDQGKCKRLRWFEQHTMLPRLNNQKEWLKHLEKMHGPSRTHTGNNAPKGAFAFTITKSDKDALTTADMIKAMNKIFKQNKSVSVIKYAWYLEYKGNDGNGLPTHPHIHGMYETATGGRIEAKHFKRAWPIWDEKTKLGAGFRGGYHRPVKSEESYKEYIAKDGGIGDSNGQE